MKRYIGFSRNRFGQQRLTGSRRSLQKNPFRYACTEEDLEILSRDGLRLVGHYVHTQGEPRRLAVLFHGWPQAKTRVAGMTDMGTGAAPNVH